MYIGLNVCITDSCRLQHWSSLSTAANEVSKMNTYWKHIGDHIAHCRTKHRSRKMIEMFQIMGNLHLVSSSKVGWLEKSQLNSLCWRSFFYKHTSSSLLQQSERGHRLRLSTQSVKNDWSYAAKFDTTDDLVAPCWYGRLLNFPVRNFLEIIVVNWRPIWAPCPAYHAFYYTWIFMITFLEEKYWIVIYFSITYFIRLLGLHDNGMYFLLPAGCRLTMPLLTSSLLL